MLGRAGRHSPEERSPQMAQMCLVSDSMVPEGCAGTFITPLMPSGGLMSSVLLTECIGELSCKTSTPTINILNSEHRGVGGWGGLRTDFVFV